MAAAVKTARHRLIASILRESPVPSQAALSAMLRRRGERVTQATLSRDLEELGAFKVRLPDGSVTYRLPDEPPVNDAHLRRMLAEFVIGFSWSGSLAVLRTPPGGANPVARAIDATNVKDVLATVAGDDTVLVVCRDGVNGRVVARRLEALATSETTSKGA
ncbi:MAG TPA: arginine repressor [Actinomycetota bacterium]|nr:arginine repressor [Actinomycetota bacterium]